MVILPVRFLVSTWICLRACFARSASLFSVDALKSAQIPLAAIDLGGNVSFFAWGLFGILLSPITSGVSKRARAS